MATFTTELLAAGGNNVGIVVPDEILDELGRGKRVPVVVTIDGGYSYRSTTAVMGGKNLISFNAETRKATGRGAGDTVEVTLEVDDAPRTFEPPAPLAEQMTEADTAAWQKLSPSAQKAHAASITDAKTDATRESRIAKVLAALR